MAQEKWLVDGPRVIDIERAQRVKVGLAGGSVSVIGSDEPGIRVEVHSVAGKPLQIALEGETLEIDHVQVGWDNLLDAIDLFRGREVAHLTVVVPRTISLRVGVARAETLVSGLRSDVSVSTASGEVVVDGHEGDLQVNAVSGEIAVRDHRGPVTVRTVSGDVTASGALHRFSGDTVSGDVFLDLRGTPDSVRVNTVSGAVTTRLEPGVAARYRINTASGTLQLDDEHITGLHGSHSSTFGDLDGSWVDLRANTVTGNVSVLHGVSA